MFRTMLAIIALGMGVATAIADDLPIGRTIDRFKLQDFQGAWHDWNDWSNRDLVVVAFVGTECPVAKLYGTRLTELAADYGSRGVQFVAIDSNQQDSLAELAQFARIHKIEFPLLKDAGNVVADQFGAVRTPEVYVLDRQRRVQYQGRIDDQFGVGFSRVAPQEHDLKNALDALLAGKPVAKPATAAVGCHIGRIERRPPRGDVTYSRQVAPILQNHCVRCHRAGEIAPFTLTSYQDVLGWTGTIREVLDESRMPPWHADPRHGKFSNDRRLPDAKKRLVLEWIENGAPEGDPRQLPPPATFSDGWQIARPDLIVEMAQPYTVPSRGTVEYQYFPIAATFDKDRWLAAAEARPGNRAVVHHIILFFVPPDGRQDLAESSLYHPLAVFAPGMAGWTAPTGMAKRIPAGSKLWFQMHYTPNGAAQQDLSRAGLVFADEKSVHRPITTTTIINFRLQIPPGAASHKLQSAYRFEKDTQIVSLLPHMHLRGKAFRFEAQMPDGQRSVLLDVPRYDFNWQTVYVLEQPLRMPRGSQLLCFAEFDNSAKNLANPDPTKTVSWGEQTWDEMMVGQFESVDDE